MTSDGEHRARFQLNHAASRGHAVPTSCTRETTLRGQISSSEPGEQGGNRGGPAISVCQFLAGDSTHSVCKMTTQRNHSHEQERSQVSKQVEGAEASGGMNVKPFGGRIDLAR